MNMCSLNPNSLTRVVSHSLKRAMVTGITKVILGEIENLESLLFKVTQLDSEFILFRAVKNAEYFFFKRTV